MIHRNTVEFEVVGDYALFSDPIMRVGGEKSTLSVPTYEALKGILHSVYWKPSLIWVIDAVRIMNPIQTEVKGIRPIRMNDGKNDLSYYCYLKNADIRCGRISSGMKTVRSLRRTAMSTSIIILRSVR